MRDALEGLLRPEEREVVLGEAEVLQLFKVSKVGTIAGCMVRSGIIQRDRQGAGHPRRHGGLQRRALAASSASRTTCARSAKGLECGIGIENFNDLKVGDRIESFRMEEVKRTLQPAGDGGAVGADDDVA